MRGRAVARVVILIFLSISTSPSMLIDIPKHSETASNDSTLDLVFLGNSYTSNNQLHVRVNNLLDAAGFDPEVQAFTSGGKTLAWHGEQAETEGSEWYDA